MSESPGFEVTADTVLDNRTGLQWQRVVPAERYTWPEAQEYAKQLILAGYDDWRLPTVGELFSIVDLGRHSSAIDPVAFPNTPSQFFWSSEPFEDNTVYTWGVSFDFGYTFNHDTMISYRVRCVR